MRIASTSTLIWLVTIALLLGTAVWMVNRASDPADDRAAGAHRTTAESVSDPATPHEETDHPDATGLQHTDDPASLATTRGAAATTTGRTAIAEPAELPALTAEQLVTLREVESEIEAAFAGDNNQAIELSLFLNQCQLAFRGPRGVELSIERAAQAFAAGKSLKQFRPNAPIQEFDSLEAFEENQWRMFDRCEAAGSLVNDSFWERLVGEADQGNPVARYLFATLVRKPLPGKLRFDQWDEELQLSEQSREYTWRNLEEREPLGLLALAQQGRFHNSLGLNGASISAVLSLAAIKCGLSTPMLLDQVDQTIALFQKMESTQPDALEKLNTASDEARRMFCK